MKLDNGVCMCVWLADEGTVAFYIRNGRLYQHIRHCSACYPLP